MSWIGRTGSLAPCFAALICLPTCQVSSPDRSEAGTVRDSAGVSIVEFATLPEGIQAWRIDEAPVWTIGTLDGTGPAAFGSVVSVSEGPEGEVIVADGHEQEIRAFDRDGLHLWTAGGRGEGPGEFQDLNFLDWSMEDTVRALDARNRSFSVFNGDGEFVRSDRLDLPEGVGSIREAAVTGIGGVVGLGSLPSASTVEFGRQRSSFALVFFDAAGSLLAESPALPGMEFVTLSANGGSAYMSYALPMGTSTQLAASGSTVAVTTQDRFEVRRYRPTGQLVQVVRVRVEPELVDLERNRAAGLPGGTLPDTLPAVGRIRVDTDERIWVEAYIPPYDDRIPTWWIFDRDGAAVATASFPPGFDPQRLAADHVLGIRADSLGVQYVDRLRLIR